MSRSNEEIQREIAELFKAGSAGEIDTNTCITKVARKILEYDGCDGLLLDYITGLIAIPTSTLSGMTCHLLLLRILRLEDDVRGLRGLIAKERVGTTQEQQENIAYRGEGKDGQA
jgi:hypothetical protein